MLAPQPCLLDGPLKLPRELRHALRAMEARALTDEGGVPEGGPQGLELLGGGQHQDAHVAIQPRHALGQGKGLPLERADHQRVEVPRVALQARQDIVRRGHLLQGDVMRTTPLAEHSRAVGVHRDQQSPRRAHAQSPSNGRSRRARPTQVRRMSVVGDMTWAARASRRWRKRDEPLSE